MLMWLLFIQVILFGLIFYRLVTTNHWTLGKKLLVCLVGAILIELVSFVCIGTLSLFIWMMPFITIPKLLIGAVMVYFIWLKEIHK